MFQNDLQCKANRKQILSKNFLKVCFNIRRSYVYKCNNYFTKEGYELPDIQFWAHMWSHISKPKPLPNWLSTNMDPFKYSLFTTRSARGFQSFHSELSVVWAKRSLVANKIESKSYYSPLILHSVRVLQKMRLNTQKQAFRWDGSFEYPRNIAYYIRNQMFLLFYSTYADASMYRRGFTLLVQLLKSKKSVFASSANMSNSRDVSARFGATSKN